MTLYERLRALNRLTAPHATLILSGLLLSLLLFHGINNHIISGSDKGITNPDMANYFRFSAELLRKSTLPFPENISVFGHVLRESWKPPLLHIADLPFILLRHDLQGAIMVNTLFLGITMVAVYGSGKILFNRRVAVFSALIYPFLPSVFALSRVLYLETALSAMVAVTFYLIISKRMDRTRDAVLAGLVMAAGALTKETYFVFLAILLIACRCRLSRTPGRHALIAALLAAGIAAVWYGADWSRLAPATYNKLMFHCEINTDPWYYLKSIFNYQLGPVFSFMLLFGFCILAWQENFLLIGITFFSLLFFTCLTNKQPRFILPLFPFLALVIAVFVFYSERWGKLIAVLTTLFAVLQFVFISYFPAFYTRARFLSPDNFVFSNRYDCGYGTYAIQRGQDNWHEPMATVATTIETAYRSGKSDVTVLMLSEAWSELSYHLTARKIPFTLFRPDDNCLSNSKGIEHLCEEYYARADYVVLDSEPGSGLFETSLRQRFLQRQNHFTPVQTVILPLQRQLSVYCRNESWKKSGATAAPVAGSPERTAR